MDLIDHIGQQDESSPASMDSEITELKEALKQHKQLEQQFRDSEERMRRIFDALPICISYTDSDQRYQENNKTYEEWFGLKRQEISGRHVSKILGESIYAASKPRIEAALAGEEQVFEAEMPLGTDGTRHVMVTYTPDVSDDGIVKGFFTAVVDISTRTEVEKALKDSEARFRKIFEHSNDAIFLIEPSEDRIVDVNAKACQLLGYSREEFLEIGISAIHPSEMPELLAFARSVLMEGQGWTDQLSCQTKLGTILPAEISASTVDIDNKTCLIALIRDTTERKEAEERIRREAARTEALARVAARLNTHLTLDGVLHAVCEESARALDADAVMLLLDDEQLAELIPAAHLGLSSAFMERYKPIPLAHYHEAITDDNPFIILSDTQQLSRLPNGELFAEYDIQAVTSVSLIRAEQLIGMLGIYCFGQQRDFSSNELSLLKGLADQASQAIENVRLRQQAEQTAVMEERSRLARDLHDSVTQALYSQMLYAEAASRELAANEIHKTSEHLQVLRHTAQQALQEMRLLIFELRPPLLEEEGLVAAIRARLEAVEERSGQLTQLSVEGDLDLTPELEASLYRITLEALNNVLKHAQASQVAVQLVQEEGTLRLDVTDNGIGFDVLSSQGTSGFGLLGMQERVARIGGRLSVESQQGQGTCVRVEVYE